MLPANLEDFGRCILADNKLAALSLEAGEVLPTGDILELSAQVYGFHMSIALASRGFDRIEQHRQLWNSAHKVFVSVLSIWNLAPGDGELLGAHRRLLAHLEATSADRIEIYSVSATERGSFRA